MKKAELLEEISEKHKEEASKFIDECIAILDKHKCYYDKNEFSWGNLTLGVSLYAQLRPFTATEVYYYFVWGKDAIFFTINHAVGREGTYERLAEFYIPRE